MPPLFLLMLLLLFPSSTILTSAYEQYLFSRSEKSENKNVQDLDAGTFKRLIKEGGEHWAIMFYSPTCGHCIHFAPTWAEVAKAVEETKKAAGVDVKVGAISCLAESSLCQDEEVHGYPSLKAFGLLPDGKGVVTKETKKDKLVKWIMDKYAEAAAIKVQEQQAQQAVVVVEDDGGTSPGKSVNTRTKAQKAEDMEEEDNLSLPELRRARVEDALTSLRFALDHDIFLGEKLLKDKALNSLKDLLHVLSLLFPGKTRRQAFGGLLEAVYPLDELSIADWEAELDTHLSVIAPLTSNGKKDYQWRICRHDAGYTCGLWILFHLLSVKSAVREEDKAASSSTSIISPPFVMKVIHGFVSHFFGCDDCREHFLGAYEELRGKWEGQGGRGAVLWIYELHDKVNVRLNKRRWPAFCGGCWKDGSKGSLPDGEVDLTAVYRTLKEAYDVHDSETMGLYEKGKNLKELASLSHDYILLVLIVFFLCFAFCMRMERKFRLGRKKRRRDSMLPL